MIKAFRCLRSDRQAPYHLCQYDDPAKQTDERTKRKMISIHTCCVLYMHAPYYLGMAWHGMMLRMCCAAHHHPLAHHPVSTLPATSLPVPAMLAVRRVLLMEMIAMIVPCKVIPVVYFLPQRCAAADWKPQITRCCVTPLSTMVFFFFPQHCEKLVLLRAMPVSLPVWQLASS